MQGGLFRLETLPPVELAQLPFAPFKALYAARR